MEGLSPLICCGTSPLRCSAKLSWVKTATELMVDLAPTHSPVSHWSGGNGPERRKSGHSWLSAICETDEL